MCVYLNLTEFSFPFIYLIHSKILHAVIYYDLTLYRYDVMQNYNVFNASVIIKRIACRSIALKLVFSCNTRSYRIIVTNLYTFAAQFY